VLQSSPDYPTKPVRLIEPFGAGGGPDLVGRALAQKLTEQWGQPVTMENISGAGATAGPAQVAKPPADGCTLLVTTSALAYSAALFKNLPYDPLKDFIPVAPLTSQSYVLVAGKLAGITTVSEQIAAAKAKPGHLKFGSTGMGTGSHLGIEKFNQAARIKAVHVPARQGEGIADTIANTVAGRNQHGIFAYSTLFRCDPQERRALVGSHPWAYISALKDRGLRSSKAKLNWDRSLGERSGNDPSSQNHCSCLCFHLRARVSSDTITRSRCCNRRRHRPRGSVS
jgi:hypothetical protein